MYTYVKGDVQMKKAGRAIAVFYTAIFTLTLLLCGCMAENTNHSKAESSHKYISQETSEESVISEKDFIGEWHCNIDKEKAPAEEASVFDKYTIILTIYPDGKADFVNTIMEQSHSKNMTWKLKDDTLVIETNDKQHRVSNWIIKDNKLYELENKKPYIYYEKH